MLLCLHVTIRQWQHYAAHSANNYRLQHQCGAGYTPHHSQHLVHRHWSRLKHFIVHMTRLTVCLELLLDSPCTEIWEKANLYRLYTSLLWLL